MTEDDTARRQRSRRGRAVKRNERVSLPLDPETALRALLAVKPAELDQHGSGGRADDETPTK